MTLAREQHLDMELLAAYAEFNLPEAMQEWCEEHLSMCPACLAIVRDLWTVAQKPDESSATLALTSQPRWLRPKRFLVAASVILAVFTCAWGMWEFRKLQRETQELADTKEQLAEAKLQLAATYKENFFRMAPSGLRSYWIGITSPTTLQLPIVRGPGTASPEALMQIKKAQDVLESLLVDPQQRGKALVELASLNIAARRMEQADVHLRQAEVLLGDSPDVKGLRAVWYLAFGDKESSKSAEGLLRELTRKYPDYLPGWYNLALFQHQSYRDKESRKAWQEYLKREERPQYRKAAEEHLARLER